MTLQSGYYIVASAAALIATAINITLFLRSRPDRLKAAIQAAMQPMADRLTELEVQSEAHGTQLGAHGVQLAEIKAEMRHGPSRNDLNSLHHRITEVVRSVSEVGALQRIHAQQLDRVNTFLMEGSRGRS